MAFFDYHACDHCGGARTFYDANLYPEWVEDHWRYGWSPGGDGYPAFPGYRVYSLCHECEKTHEIIIRPRAEVIMPDSQDPTPPKDEV